MNIIFLCGSIEPGRNGVGDYTRRLAGELIGRGNKIGVIALNDHHLSQEFTGIQQLDGIQIPVLRLPSHWQSIERFNRAKLWIDDFNPEWLSIQFVPFSFDPKGLFFGLSTKLLKIGKGKYWHIMVHELWVGMDKEASLKFIFWGWVQRKLIKSLCTKLKPKIIHTQSVLYCTMLKRIGFNANLLPLFGNIPLASSLRVKGDDVRHNISFVLFGGIHPGAPVKEFINDLKAYSVSSGKEIEMKIIGRCGTEQLKWELKCKEVGLPIQLLGEQSPKLISKVLSNATFGISTTPAFLIDKSGSVAAMREHGLNILCVSRAWHPRGITSLNLPSGVVQYKRGEIAQFIKGNFNSHRSNNITDIANQFVNNLSVAV